MAACVSNDLELFGLDDDEIDDNFQDDELPHSGGDSVGNGISMIYLSKLKMYLCVRFIFFTYTLGFGRWSPAEHKIFLQGIKEHGKGWKRIAAMIGTRNVVQVRTHAQKYFQKVNRMKANEENEVAESEPVQEKKVAVKRKRKGSKGDIEDASIVKKIGIRPDMESHIDLADLASDGTPSPTSVEGVFSIGDSGKQIWIPVGFVDDWFLHETGSASPFTSVDSSYEDSSLSGEDDCGDRQRHRHHQQQSPKRSVLSSIESDISSVEDFLQQSFDEDVLDSGILEIFGH